MKTISVVNALAALAQKSRLEIYRLLVQAGPGGIPAGKISALTSIPASTLTFHLKELAHANLVSSRNEGRFVIYSANFKTMNTVISYLSENCCGGNPCISTSIPACSATEQRHS